MILIRRLIGGLRGLFAKGRLERELVLAASVLLASVCPARRAATIDPLAALRQE